MTPLPTLAEQRAATIEFLVADRDQHQEAATEWMRRYEAAQARIAEARAETKRARAELGAYALRWTDLGQALLDAARAETGAGELLRAALDAVEAEEAADLARRYPQRRRVG